MLIKSLHGPQSRRAHRLTYRGHRSSYLSFSMGKYMNFGDPCRSNPPCNLDQNRYTYRSLHAEQKSQWAQIRRTHRLTYRGHRRPHIFLLKITNMNFGDLCRSNGGSYDFGAMKTFVQHAKILSILIQIVRGGNFP